MRYEIIHDTIAKQAFQKASIEARQRRKMEKFIQDEHERYVKHGTLLTQEDIEYINPHRDAVNISDEQHAFIVKSRREIRRKARVRRRIIGSTMAVLTLLLAGALIQWQRANSATQTALNARDSTEIALDRAQIAEQAALDSAEVALQLRAIAEVALDSAEISAQQAREAQQVAVLARDSAEVSAQQARDAQQIAETARNESWDAELKSTSVAVSSVNERALREQYMQLVQEEIAALESANANGESGNGVVASLAELKASRLELEAQIEAASRATQSEIEAFDEGVVLQLGAVDRVQLVNQGVSLATLQEQFFAQLANEMYLEQNVFLDEGREFGFREIPGDYITEFQSFLHEAGFLANQSDIHGVFDYNTHAAGRLWYEYIRTVEQDVKFQVGVADGAFGLVSRFHRLRWTPNNITRKAWSEFSAQQENSEAAFWLSTLKQVHQSLQESPPPFIQKIEDADPEVGIDTRRLAAWTFDSEDVHLIAIRRKREGEIQFDDIFILLINGQTYKFLGSVTAGRTSNPQGAPYLLPGQHLYRKAFHQRRYRAFRTNGFIARNGGVLILRTPEGSFDHPDVNKPLQANTTINMHWAGRGVSRVGGWSQGSQVIAGGSYINPYNELIDYSATVAINNVRVGQTNEQGEFQNKGAYAVFVDLIWALSDDPILYYTLLEEEYLSAHPQAHQIVEETYERLISVWR